MRILGLLFVVAATFVASAQITYQPTAGTPSGVLTGTGDPSAVYACNSNMLNLLYIQLNAGSSGNAPGFLWVCVPPTVGGTPAWTHLTLPQTTNSSGTFLNETCVHALVTSSTAGAWTVSYPSIGSTVTSINATSVSAAGTIAGSSQATVTTATTTGATGAVLTFGTLNVLGVNVTIPLLSTTATPVYVQICATP